MAASKLEHDDQSELLGKITWDKNVPISIDSGRIMDVCRIVYTKAISIKVIQHLLGGPNMEYNSVMEVQNSIDCFNFCKHYLLENVTKEKKEILWLEDRNCESSNILIILLKQKKTG